jgi:hypothetical protein
MDSYDLSTAQTQPSVPYLILRLHIRSLGYQQLSSGGVSIHTCLHQRRVVVLNQAQCEGEVEQLD